jgi:hypothetical protein
MERGEHTQIGADTSILRISAVSFLIDPAEGSCDTEQPSHFHHRLRCNRI